MKTALLVGLVLAVGGFVAYEVAKPYLDAANKFKGAAGFVGDLRGISSDIKGITGSAKSIFGGISDFFGDSSSEKSGGSGDGGTPISYFGLG